MLREELKKIWSPWILLVIAALGAVFYWMFLAFSINHFPNGPYMQAQFDVAAEMVEIYGTTLEQDEYEEFTASLSSLVSEADVYIQANSLAQEYGITSYREYLQFDEEADDISNYSGDESDPAQKRYADAQRISSYLISDETNNIGGRIVAVELYIQQYEVWKENGIDILAGGRLSYSGDQEYANALNLFFGEEEAWRNILPYEITQTTSTYLGYLLVWMMLSACILIAPVLVKDRMRNIRPLQWSSSRGRGVLKTQFAAIMLSVLLLTTINLVIFGGLFLTNGVRTFFECRMFSFMMTGYSWVNWSFGLWCCVLAVICYLVCFGVGGVIFFLSCHSGNYISMLLKVIPIFVVCALLAVNMLTFAFYYNNAIYQQIFIPLIEMMAAGIVLAIGTALSAIAVIRPKRKDLLI